MHIDAKLVNCDLCILAYQNYHQSVIWPLDPTGRSIPSSPAFTGDGSKFLVLQAAKYVTDSLRRVPGCGAQLSDVLAQLTASRRALARGSASAALSNSLSPTCRMRWFEARRLVQGELVYRLRAFG